MQHTPIRMRISFAKLIGSKTGFGFATILLLAITLRFFDLDAREVWLDEAFSWNQASMGFAEMLSSVARDVHPPLYQAVLWVNTRIFGESPFALRLPSAIFSCIAVAMTYFFTCRISTKTAALLAMTFTTISTFQLWYAQEARMYSLLAMLTLGSMIMLLCLLKETSKRNLAGYILLSVFLLYTHVYGIFILLAQQFFYLYLWISKRCPAHLTLSCWIRVHLLIAISFLPWLWILIRQFTKIQNNFWIQQPGISDLQQTLNTYQSLPLIIFFGTVVLACAGLVKASVNKDQADQFRSQYSGTALLIFWLCVPILAPFLLSQIMQPIFVARYTISAAFPWYILVAIGICSLPKRAAAPIAIVILAFSAANLSPYYKSRIAMVQWSEVSAFVEENSSEGDYLIFHSDFGSIPFRYHGDTSNFVVINIDSGFDPALKGISLNELPMIIKPDADIWLVTSYTERLRLSTEAIVNLIGKTHNAQEERKFGGVQLLKLEPAD